MRKNIQIWPSVVTQIPEKKRGNWQVLPVGQLADEKLTHMDRLEALTSVFEVQSLELAIRIEQKRTHLHCRILWSKISCHNLCIVSSTILLKSISKSHLFASILQIRWKPKHWTFQQVREKVVWGANCSQAAARAMLALLWGLVACPVGTFKRNLRRNGKMIRPFLQPKTPWGCVDYENFRKIWSLESTNIFQLNSL